jgi:hypothetical protein
MQFSAAGKPETTAASSEIPSAQASGPASQPTLNE